MTQYIIFFLMCYLLAGFSHGQGSDSITVRYNTRSEPTPRVLDFSRTQAHKKYGFWELVGDIGLATTELWANDRLANVRQDHCHEGDCENGKGVELHKINKVFYAYVGEFQRGKFHGKGKYYLLYKDDFYLIYEGEYRHGKEHGKGIQYDFTAISSGGLVKNTAVTLKRSYYEGDFSFGKRSGKGAYYDAGKTLRYLGSWYDGRASGTGKLFNAAGLLIYNGNFRSGRFDGYGSSYYTNGQVSYQGAWDMGIIHGKGAKYFRNGQLECECTFHYKRPRGRVKLYYANGKVRFDGRIPQGTSWGWGQYTFPGGATFRGSWRYHFNNHKFKSRQVIGKVRGSDGKRIRRIRVFDYRGEHANYMRTPVLLEAGLISGLMDRHRFTGLERNPWPNGWWKNCAFNVHLWGPRFARWSRIYPFVFFNTRKYTFPEDNGSFYIPWQYVPEENHTGEYEEVLFAKGEDARAPMVIVNHEVGVGAKLHVPLSNESTLMVGGGIVLHQHANLRLHSLPFVRKKVEVRRDKFRNVLNYGRKDLFAEIGFRISYYRISVRTYYRHAVVSNDRFPVYVRRVTGLGYEPYRIRTAARRIRPQLNFSFFLPTGKLKDKGDRRRLRRYFPFP